jgi:hypothetical protein
MSLWEYLWAWSWTTNILYHFNWNSNDSSWNSNNWTATNISYVIDGLLGKCAYTTSWKIIISSVPNLWDFTISLWIKPTSNRSSDPSKSDNMFVDIRNSSTANQLCLIKYYDWVFMFQMYNGSVYQITSTLPLYNWHLITCIRNNNQMSLYTNWKLIQTITAFSTALSPNIFQLFEFDGSDKYNAQWCIDEFIVENRSWSASEIKKYYTYARGRFGII